MRLIIEIEKERERDWGFVNHKVQKKRKLRKNGETEVMQSFLLDQERFDNFQERKRETI